MSLLDSMEVCSLQRADWTIADGQIQLHTFLEHAGGSTPLER